MKKKKVTDKLVNNGEKQFLHINLTKEEKQEINALIAKLVKNVLARCEENNCNDSSISSSLYGIQDYLGSFEVC